MTASIHTQSGSFVARIAVAAVLLSVAVAAWLAQVLGFPLRALRGQSDSGPDGLRVILLGTFYNPGWLRSHLLPLIRCPDVSAITVVCDAPLDPYDKVTYACPTSRLARRIGRTAARFHCLLRSARTNKSHVLIGYHIMPNALLCLLAARWHGAAAIYQMTGGPVQIIGGGVGSENVLLRKQGRPGPIREALMFHLVRRFDAVVVRGRKAQAFLESRRLARRIAVLPGGIDTHRYSPNGRARSYDLVAVGRLVPVKRLDRLLQIAAALKARRPRVRIAIAGDGPLLTRLQEQSAELALDQNLVFLGRRDDVPDVLRQSRTYVLTSENEGLSIAMLEALATGLPVIIPDVGDLTDVVEFGRNGLRIDPDDPEQAAADIDRLLSSEDQLEAMSQAARRSACDYADVDVVAERWRTVFAALSER